MLWLVVTDIHGNLPALQAVFASPEARRCDRIISLGDHTNFGPQPREVQQLLEHLGAVMLLGNHEERLSHLNEARFQPYNWGILHWTAAQLRDLRITWPTDYQIGPVWCTHGTPGDPYQLVRGDGAWEALSRLPQGVTHLVSGHNHISWQVTQDGRMAFNPGSLGVLEDPVGGMAAFGVLEVTGRDVHITRHLVPYDVNETARAYLASGCAKAAPEISRLILNTMRRGVISTLELFNHVSKTAAELGLDPGSREAWQAGDLTWQWPEPIPSVEFWNDLEREL